MREMDCISFVNCRRFLRRRTTTRSLYIMYFCILQVTNDLRPMIGLDVDKGDYCTRRRDRDWFFRGHLFVC